MDHTVRSGQDSWSIALDERGHVVGICASDIKADRMQLIGGIEIHGDGTVVVPPNMSMTDAARAFWDSVRTMGLEIAARNGSGG